MPAFERECSRRRRLPGQRYPAPERYDPQSCDGPIEAAADQRSEVRGNLGELSAGLGFKLVLGPALIAALLIGGLGATGRIVEVTVFEAAMGPQIGGAIVAMQNGLNPRLITLMVGIGILLSLATAALWFLLLTGA